MTDALALITSLSESGKSPVEIARELHSQGVTDRRGKFITPAIVEGMLRFAELPIPEAATAKLSNAGWGHSRKSAETVSKRLGHNQPEKKPKKNRRIKFLHDDREAEVKRLYQVDLMKPGDIARKLGLDYRRVTMYCGQLAGYSVPPGEVEEVIENGVRVMRCPPGYARGYYPQRNVGLKGGS